MHLVVLKRNLVELPSTLPSSLMPYTPASDEPFAADLGEHLSHGSPSPPPAVPAQTQASWLGSSTAGAEGSTHWQQNNSTAAGGDLWSPNDQVHICIGS